MLKTNKMSVSLEAARADHCHRCGGFMVPERVVETGSDNWRCVSCGERIDPVILTHRQQTCSPNNAQKLSVGHSASRLDQQAWGIVRVEAGLESCFD